MCACARKRACSNPHIGGTSGTSMYLFVDISRKKKGKRVPYLENQGKNTVPQDLAREHQKHRLTRQNAPVSKYRILQTQNGTRVQLTISERP